MLRSKFLANPVQLTNTPNKQVCGVYKDKNYTFTATLLPVLHLTQGTLGTMPMDPSVSGAPLVLEWSDFFGKDL